MSLPVWPPTNKQEEEELKEFLIEDCGCSMKYTLVEGERLKNNQVRKPDALSTHKIADLFGKGQTTVVKMFNRLELMTNKPVRDMKTLECAGCGKEFERTISQYNQSIKRDQETHYCSIECSADFDDKISPFKKLVSQCKTRNTHGKSARLIKSGGTHTPMGFNITAEYLAELFEDQGGKCADFDVPLLIPKSGSKKDILPKHPCAASIDRIDSNQGYIKGNVRLVCQAANYGKNDYDMSDWSEFIKNIFLINIDILMEHYDDADTELESKLKIIIKDIY